METVNGMFVGPRVVAREGDRLVVKVVNHVPNNISIHWHGIRQLQRQRGTLFWHTHFSWLRATVYGPSSSSLSKMLVAIRFRADNPGSNLVDALLVARQHSNRISLCFWLAILKSLLMKSLEKKTWRRFCDILQSFIDLENHCTAFDSGHTLPSHVHSPPATKIMLKKMSKQKFN
ncbi:hypothetical protein D5086_002194 [Populus alba]|uniref:Uncharacterized protein n=1 Tax=Populus alba TaxID=43335 RepID=A0ACC4D1B8_POPAL